MLGIPAITVLPWYRGSGASGLTFGDLHSGIGGASAGNVVVPYGFAPTYFRWLGYLLLVLAVGGALLCTLRPAWAGLLALCAPAGLTAQRNWPR